MPGLDDYHYELPKKLIAQQPLPQRSDARLLVVDRASQSLGHYHVRDLPAVLRPPDCIVLNETRVIPARLVGYRTATSGRWEGLFLSADEEGNWQILSRSRGKLTPGETVTVVGRDKPEEIVLRLLLHEPDGSWIVRPQNAEESFALLERVGRVPLPPYIREGEMVDRDRVRYQTVFARYPGSVAAPTAGLHFTQELLSNLERTGIGIARVTLHVGVDTFRPISTANLEDHAMHSEAGSIDAQAIETALDARRRGGRIIAVGSTAVRVLETAAADGTLRPWSGRTNLFIRPPYEFRAVDGLLTNFHLPGTTLLVLVRTFGGDALVRHAYAEAIREEYRFYSYGDAMLIL